MYISHMKDGFVYVCTNYIYHFESNYPEAKLPSVLLTIPSEDHALVYWTEEDCVSIVDIKNICS